MGTSLVQVVRISIPKALSLIDEHFIGRVSEDYSFLIFSVNTPPAYARSRSSNIINANNIAMRL